ncbi:Stk1 family PASTA domain-containing Ser/Thr kinase [Atopobacter phocae]|uniref:Stk1 family PASTA domain-containing Ser/Thr kinase n=1 Tax=Atopobacter phocae TaxID=136492 RepID=UPI0004B3163D|nr:Stk1 family PASTA domain-containing Ser/Thr kinase [Atopobacter phocae]
MISIGDKLGGRYKIIDFIGSGGMSNVYLGEDLILNREVAVKVLRFDFLNNKDSIRRFKREALSAAQLSHPNIVAVYDIDEEEGQQYIVMEYNDGEDLKEFIRDYGRIDPQRSVFIMKQLLEAMSVAHQHRIIHRDIKSQNILIDHNDHVQITDFGIAVALSETSVTQTNTLLGSVHYLSPEQARGSMATIRSDIYALGIVLYEMLMGEVPFDGDSPVSIALKHFQEAIPSLRRRYPEIPQSLENVVLKATTKDPMQRYKSCEEMYEDLTTVFSPNRRNELPFQPNDHSKEKTMVIKPVPELLAETKRQQDLKEQILKEKHQENKKQKTVAPVPKKKSIFKRLILFIFLISLISFTFFLGRAYMMSRPKEVSVPDVTNLTEIEATDRLEDVGLHVGKITERSDESIDAGNVIKTDPEANAIVKEGATINLLVSRGSKLVKMKDYTGIDYAEARKELKKLGFNVERYEEESDEMSDGKILRQSITPGDEVDPSKTTISLTVAIGSESFAVTDLTNQTEANAENYAKSNQLQLVVNRESSSTVDKGRVIRQLPEGGSTMKKGNVLTVTISTGPEETKLQSFTVLRKVSYLPPSITNNGKQSNLIQVFVKDDVHTMDTPVQELEITENTELTIGIQLKPGNSGQYRILRDGKEVEFNSNVVYGGRNQ